MKKKEGREGGRERHARRHGPQHSVAASDTGASTIALVVAAPAEVTRRTRVLSIKFYGSSLLPFLPCARRRVVYAARRVHIRRECLTAADENRMPVYTRSQLSRLSAMQCFLPLFAGWQRQKQHHRAAFISPLAHSFLTANSSFSISLSLFLSRLSHFALSPMEGARFLAGAEPDFGCLRCAVTRLLASAMRRARRSSF